MSASNIGGKDFGVIVPSVHTLTAILLSGLWLAFIVWTIHWLGSAKAQSDRFVFKFGVKGFGITAWLAATAIVSYVSFQNRPDRSLLSYVGIYGFALLPISLWLGFAWGRAMAAFFSNRRAK